MNDKRDKATAALMIKNWIGNRNELIAKLPHLYDLGDDQAEKERCLNLDVRGLCKSGCIRDHSAATPATYTEIWDACKEITKDS